MCFCNGHLTNTFKFSLLLSSPSQHFTSSYKMFRLSEATLCLFLLEASSFDVIFIPWSYILHHLLNDFHCLSLWYQILSTLFQYLLGYFLASLLCLTRTLYVDSTTKCSAVTGHLHHVPPGRRRFTASCSLPLVGNFCCSSCCLIEIANKYPTIKLNRVRKRQQTDVYHVFVSQLFLLFPKETVF